MLLRCVAATSLALTVAVACLPSQPAFSQPSGETAPAVSGSEEAAPTVSGSDVTLSVATPPSNAAPAHDPAKPKRRVKPKQMATANSGPTFGTGFGEFSLLRLFGISAIPRTTVAFPGNLKPGTIVIHTAQRRLYLVLGQGEALRYGIGVGREGFTWRGVRTVTDKREWPSWTPPPQMLARRPDLPRHMAGGRDNPLGARAMYLGDSLYRIHGTNEYDTIGTAASSGCIRLTNEDVIDLYSRVRLGATVIVQ